MASILDLRAGRARDFDSVIDDDVATAAPTLSERTVAFIDALRFEDLPAEVVTKAKRLIAHDIGQGLAGVRLDEGRQAITIAQRLSGDAGTATVLGTPSKLRPHDASFANTSLMRATGLDDVILPHGIHAGMCRQRWRPGKACYRAPTWITRPSSSSGLSRWRMSRS